MIDITKAIQSLDKDAQFVISGSPSNETEYQAQVKYITGADENGSAIFSDTQPWTWTEVSAKQAELQAEYDANQYQRDRATAYPSIQEQLDMQYWDKVNGTTNWEDAIAKVKTDNPKS